MICASFVLALFLAWPVLVGGGGAAVNAAVPQPPSLQAAPPAAPKVVKASVAPTPKVESCYARYEKAYAACGNDGGCRMNAAAAWDVCEAAD